jgi:hypothetical protein
VSLDLTSSVMVFPVSVVTSNAKGNALVDAWTELTGGEASPSRGVADRD